MNFNFRKSNKPRIQRLFIPLNSFSFATFVVPIKFRAPVSATMISASRNTWTISSTRARLDGPPN
jgi:hypothetical protein